MHWWQDFMGWMAGGEAPGRKWFRQRQQLALRTPLDKNLPDSPSKPKGIPIAAIPPEDAKKAYNHVRELLKAGQPAQAQLAIANLGSDFHLILGDLQEIANAWILSQEQAQRGEFAKALTTIENINYRHYPSLLDLVDEWDRVRTVFHAKKEALLTARIEKNRKEIARLAAELLVLAPLFTPAKDALAEITDEPTEETFINPKLLEPLHKAKVETMADRYLCWVDGVGGYLLCLQKELKLGRAATDSQMDIPIYADISRHHATLQRDQEGSYLLQAVRPTFVNGKQVSRTLLKDGDEITLGSICKIKFRKPLKVSGTALLKIQSNHRLPMSLDGVILMADACLMGDNSEVHIPVADLNRPVALVRQKDQLAVQSTGSYSVNDLLCKDKTPLPDTCKVHAEDFRFALEPTPINFINGS